MKTVWRAKFGLMAGVLLLASTGLAQKEQWLRYYPTSQMRGYRYLDLTTNAPPEVQLPPAAAGRYYARWTTPLDPKGERWMCFDQSRKSGPYDRLYIDTKGANDLGKTPVGPTRTDPITATFDGIKMVFKGDDGPITYHLQLRFMKFSTEKPRLLAASGGYYAGDVDLGGKKVRVELTDGNANGCFNDCGETIGDTDRVEIKGNKHGVRYLGKLVEVNGEFFRLEVARDGAFVKVQKAENVVLGKVTVPQTISQFVAFGPNGHFTRQPEKGELTLPAGKYAVQQWTISRKDNAGATWELMATRAKEACAFEVTESNPAKVNIGEPVRMEIEPQESTNRVGFSLSFVGSHGESISVTKGEQRPPGPKLLLASLDGTYRSTNTFEFG